MGHVLYLADLMSAICIPYIFLMVYRYISCLPYSLLFPSTWYIGIYTVDTLLYSLCFTNCIISFLSQLSYHPQVLTLSCNLSYSSRL